MKKGFFIDATKFIAGMLIFILLMGIVGYWEDCVVADGRVVYVTTEYALIETPTRVIRYDGEVPLNYGDSVRVHIIKNHTEDYGDDRISNITKTVKE